MAAPQRWLGSIAVAGLSFVYYVSAAAAGPYWLDASELAAQAFTLGISHPPGHPLFGLLGKAATLVPLGSVSLRVAAAAGLAASAAAGLLFLVTYDLVMRGVAVTRAQDGGAGDEGTEATPPAGRWLVRREGQVRPGPWLAAVVAGATSLFVAAGYSYAFQAVRAEVYALHALGALLVVSAVLRALWTGQPRWLCLAAFIGALALANHHLLMVSVLLPVVLVAAVRRGGVRWRTVARVAFFVLLGSCLWLYLPLRAARNPQVNWGDPETPSRFVWTVSAQAFSGKSLDRARDPTFGGAGSGLLRLGGRELGPVVLLGPLGLFVLVRRERRAAALLGGVVVAGVGATWLVGFDAHNPDIHGYLAVPVALMGAGAGVALSLLLVLVGSRGRSRLVAGLALTALMVMPTLQAVRAFPTIDLRRARGCETVTHALLETVPPGGVLLTAYYETAFALWYAQAVEGSRPDVAHAHLTFLGFPGYADSVARRAPRLAPLVTHRHQLRAAVARLAGEHPVILEYDISTPPDVAELLAYAGLATEVVLDGGRRQAARDEAAARQRHAYAALAERLGDDAHEPQTRRVLLYRAYVELLFHCRAGLPAEPQAAAWALARAQEVAPDDPLLAAAARRCGLPLKAPPPPVGR